MKNVFNQRQLGYKVTANSLYGQCGARTSAFYDKDIDLSQMLASVPKMDPALLKKLEQIQIKNSRVRKKKIY